MKKLTFGFLLILLTLTSFTVVGAWEQPAHMAINYEAIENFKEVLSEDEKYINAPLDFENQYGGLYVTSSSWFQEEGEVFSGYKDELKFKTLAEWIIHGGYSADEPNIYESMRHFYDPVGKNGVSHLLSQANSKDDYGELLDDVLDGFVNPEIDARIWALTHGQNPYNFDSAIDYYYKAMTISDFDTLGEFEAGSNNFRCRNLTAEDFEELRSFYLGAAFRAVGETMHLMADMTQPAHVRNDAHPFTEPIEQGTTPDMVRKFAEGILQVDPFIGDEYYSETFANRQSLSELFHKTAEYTNRTMFSLDTISDTTLKINPANGLEAYDSPQITGLIAKDTKWSDLGSSITYYKNINGIEVPMLYKNLAGKYKIAQSYAQKQSEVLIPIAIAGCTEVLDRFIPTMELKMEVGKTNLIADSRNRGIEQISLDIEMIHDYEKDVEWLERGMEIEYSGPGMLVIETEKKTRKIPVLFEEGNIIAARDGREIVYIETSLYRKNDSRAKLTDEQKLLEVESGDVVYVEVDAGGRIFRSKEIIVESGEYDIEVVPETPYSYEEVGFRAVGTGDESLFYVWDFDDGTEPMEGEGVIEANHIFEKGGDYKVSVSIYEKRNRKGFIGRAFELVKVDGKVYAEIYPANNLQGLPGTSSEISVKSMDSRVSLDRHRIEWDINGVEFTAEGTNAVLSFKEEGDFDINVRIYDSDDTLVGKAYASLYVGEPEDELRVEPSDIYLEAFEAQTLTVYLNERYLGEDEYTMEVQGGERNGYFRGGTYNAPRYPGIYTIRVTLIENPDMFIDVPVTVTSDEVFGHWELAEITNEVKEPSWGTGGSISYSGTLEHEDGYFAETINFTPDSNSTTPPFSYTITAGWSAPPKILQPEEVYDMEIELTVSDGYEGGRISISSYFVTERKTFKIGGEALGDEEGTFSGVFSREVPKHGEGTREAQTLYITVNIDPFYQFAGNVKYIYRYEFVVN